MDKTSTKLLIMITTAAIIAAATTTTISAATPGFAKVTCKPQPQLQSLKRLGIARI
jgi:hypothetical protein